MEIEIPDNPYLLLTPGPLSTSPGVRRALLQDWCTWDDDYNELVQGIRRKLVNLATPSTGYSSVLMQGSGTFSVESVVGSCIPEKGEVLVLVNGAYGRRIAEIAQKIKVSYHVVDFGELAATDVGVVARFLEKNPRVTHVVMVHCETTTGMLNPVDEISTVIKSHGKQFILDAMSSFGGIPLDIQALGVDFLISSANKCIQGVPGFGFVIASENAFHSCKNISRSLSLDLFDQWNTMEKQNGKWRFTSPTHSVRAFSEALHELEEEGGVKERFKRYTGNQQVLVAGMKALGFECLLPEALHSPIITSFKNPDSDGFDFQKFYLALKKQGFVIYPGKVSHAATFRIGNIGHVFEKDIHELLHAISISKFW